MESGGIVLSCGKSTENQLGYVTKEHVQHVFRPIRTLHQVVQLSAGNKHSLALDTLGRVFSWGQGTGGCLGLGDLHFRAVPTLVPGLAHIGQIATGLEADFSVCVGCGDGRLYGWGDNSHGQFGQQFATPVLTPKPLHVNGSVAKVACGQRHMMVLDVLNNSLLTIGCNESGACGSTLLKKHVRFTKAQPKFPSVTTIQGIACGIDTSYYWCDNGDLFRFSPTISDLPTQVLFKECGVRVCKVVCSSTHSLYLSSDGRAFSRQRWQRRGSPERFAQQVDGVVVDVACGASGQFVCVDEDGQVFSWGKGPALGSLNARDKATPRPVLVDRVLGAVNVACGRDFTLCLVGFNRPPTVLPTTERTLSSLVEQKMVDTMDAFNFAQRLEYASRHNFGIEQDYSPLEQACLDFVLANFDLISLVNPGAMAKLCVEEEEEEEEENEQVVAVVAPKHRVKLPAAAVATVEEEREPLLPPQPFCGVCNIAVTGDAEAHEQSKPHRAAYRRLFPEDFPAANSSSNKRKGGKKQLFVLPTDGAGPRSAPWSIPPPSHHTNSSLRQLLSSSPPSSASHQPTKSPSSPLLPSSASWGESKSPVLCLEFALDERHKHVVRVTKPPPSSRMTATTTTTTSPSKPQSLRDIAKLQATKRRAERVPLERSAWGYLPPTQM